MIVTRFQEEEPAYEEVPSMGILDFAIVNAHKKMLLRVENPNRSV